VWQKVHLRQADDAILTLRRQNIRRLFSTSDKQPVINKSSVSILFTHQSSYAFL